MAATYRPQLGALWRLCGSIRSVSNSGGRVAPVNSKTMTHPTPDLFSDELVAFLEVEWRVVLAAVDADVASWKETIGELAGEYWDIRQRGEWRQGPADFFGILGRDRDELSHSAMLAWLFNPSGRHGLGEALLDRIVSEHLPDLEAGSFRVRRVEVEVQRADTRADIIVWGDIATIVIEVKVDAGEGIRQCDRLVERFGEEPGARFIFLTPSGRRPLTATGEAAEVWRPVSFRHLREALEEVFSVAGGGEAAGVVANYLLTMKREFQ